MLCKGIPSFFPTKLSPEGSIKWKMSHCLSWDDCFFEIRIRESLANVLEDWSEMKDLWERSDVFRVVRIIWIVLLKQSLKYHTLYKQDKKVYFFSCFKDALQVPGGYHRKQFQKKIAIWLWEVSSCLILNLRTTQIFLGVLELEITANSSVLYIFNGQKPSRDFSFHSSFITCFRDSTKECACTVPVDIQKRRRSMQDTASVTDFATHYHKLQWLLALAENKKWQLRSEYLGVISSQIASIFYITSSHLTTTLSLLSSPFKIIQQS